MQEFIGRTLGHYRIVEQIGAGGMGVVYRAHDERLDRDVAIKVLPDEVAGVQDRLARFEREAKLLASLNHSNIATLHGLEEEGNARFLVMELVEGESLAAFIARGALPADEAVPIAIQIAQALEAAHEQSIIHRDLKPANVMVDSEGQVKVLDFGLAKAFDPNDSPQSSESLAESPTLTADLTRGGVLLGTAAYMSPEQARGKPVDKRADIWAFGCTLFEMLTAKRPFGGATSTEILASIIKEDVDWNLLRADTPGAVHRLLRRCLTKNPRDRLHDVADVRIELQSFTTEDSQREGPTPSARFDSGRRNWIPRSLTAFAGFVFGAIGAALVIWGIKPSASNGDLARFDHVLPRDHRLVNRGGHMLSLSSDGRGLVYSTNSGLYLRQKDRPEPIPIQGTEGFSQTAGNPFLSPDGEYVGFWADGMLRKVRVNGGAPVALCRFQNPRGASWGIDDRILVGQGSEGIWEVAANGGSPKQLIAVDPQKGESAHGPQLLPDGRSVLFTLNTGTGWDNAQVVAQEMDTGERYLLVDGGADGRYVPTGHIVFVQGSTLYASACDIDDFEVAGSRVPLVENLRLAAGIASPGTAQFSISSSGTIAYIKKPATRWLGNLVWVDRDGVAVPINDDVRSFGFLSLSPNGQSAAVTISEGLTREIWIYDLTGTRPPFPIQRGGCSWDPVWTADGRRVVFAYAEVHNSTEDLYSFSVDGKDLRPEIFHGQIGQQYPYAVSADGKELYFCNFGGGEKWDVWVYDMTGASDPKPLLASDFREVYATTSPDKRWIAYSSNRTGRPEIWIASYPSLEQRQPVSTDGGYEPRWSHDGRELFYRIGGRMMVVAIKEEGGVVSFEPPGVLFEQFYWGPGVWPSYGVAPDGRFLMIQRADAPPTERDSDRIRIVLNWFEELERLVPTD